MTLKEIKERQAAREWADVEALARTLAPTFKKNAELRREEEIRKAKEQRRKRIRNRRKNTINAALHNAGIPLRIL